ncbi:response regulator transcription factor [Priestia megaterium]|uniref:response regulator transcription factor n=1 Tax=Priestia megaterium TaxID=1404 RepID=UPI00077D8A08|nr:response regulator transcription factor [Priestia megaterium]
MKLINVVIVEDDNHWSKLLLEFLDTYEDIKVVGTANTSEEAIDLISQVNVDIVLMDINLSEQESGIISCSRITELHPRLKIIMLTGFRDEEMIKKSFNAGATNYILKENYKSIPQKIRETCSNFNPIEVLLEELYLYKKEEILHNLTCREREIYNLYERGYKRSQIEKALIKSTSTVKTQIHSILKKTKCKNMDEIKRKVRTRGIL